MLRAVSNAGTAGNGAVPGTQYVSGGVYGYAGGTVGSAITINRLYVIPFRFDRAVTISKLGAQCTGALAGNAKFGIYDSSGSGGRPGAKIAEGNQDVSTVATGYLSSTFASNPTIQGGINWLAICCSAAVTWSSSRGDNVSYGSIVLIDGSDTGSNLHNGWYSRYVALAYVAGPTPFMPASFGASTFNSGDNSPLVSFTVA